MKVPKTENDGYGGRPGGALRGNQDRASAAAVPRSVYTKDPIHRIVSRVTHSGHRSSLADATEILGRGTMSGMEWLLSAFRDPPPPVVTLRPGAGVEDVTNAVLRRSIGPGGSATAAGVEHDRAVVTRQVTLTDFCRPEAERPGAVVLAVRHQLDLVGEAVAMTPPGRDYRDLAEAWRRLSDVASVSVSRAECGGVRASLMTLSFLVACLRDEYANRDAAEALRSHVLANYRDARVGARMDAVSECLRVMVRTHVFPHRVFRFYGGLLSWMSQDELASVTAVVRGTQEAARTDQTAAPRSSVNAPACAFMDVDSELRLGSGDAGPSGACYVYLLFVYAQRPRRESVRVYLAKSRLNEAVFREGLAHVFSRTRVDNVIHGTDGADAPRPDPNAEFPLLRLYGDRNATRCPPARLGDPDAVNALYRWTPDLRGWPGQGTCTYAAYARLGVVMADRPKVTRRHERYGSIEVPMVWIEGLTWLPGEWIECYF